MAVLVDAVRGALRESVLSGQIVGRQGAGSEVAAFVATSDPAYHLARWFGIDWIAALRELKVKDAAGTLRAALDRDIAALDRLLSEQLDEIFRHPRLLRLEGSWRGLLWLVKRQPRSQSRIRIRVFNASWKEICRDLERASEFDQSQMFGKIYEEQFGIGGGEPFGLLACDYEVRHRPSRDYPTDDIAALSFLASVAASSFSPVVLGAAPELLGVQSFVDLTPAADLEVTLRDSEHVRWRQFTGQEDLRFLGIVLPRMLARPPWTDLGCRADGFRFRHRPGEPARRVWMSAVYGFAAVVLRAFERNAWPAELRGAEIGVEATGGVIDRLPTERFPSDPPDADPPRAPLDLALTDLQEDQLNHGGLIPLAALEWLPEACFGALPSVHRPPRQTSQTSPTANANQRISTQINTLLCACRFAHCVKLMGREMIGSYIEPKEVEVRLQRWLNGYVGGSGLSRQDSTARYPLRSASVEVRERRDQPGVYQCAINLVPHHQLDEVGAGFRLVTDFAQRPDLP